MPTCPRSSPGCCASSAKPRHSGSARCPGCIDRLDRPDLLIRVLQSAQLRTPLVATALRTAAPASRLAAAVVTMQSRQLQVVSQARSLATQLDLTRVGGLTWQGARDQATQVVSLGDLIDGEHGRGEVSRRAAQTFEEIGRIVACLHAEFSGVLPSIRLDWAETLSQFDEAPSLRRLGSLARWGEIPYVDRYQMQAFVDWLFSRINPTEPRAESLMNDVVRMCLLLASDAPVGRIIAGRLPRPITVRPGVRLPLTAFDPTKLRVGMEALVYRESNVVARAVVEDIGASEIAARVIHTAQPQVDLDVNVRVQFGAATALSRVAATRPVAARRQRKPRLACGDRAPWSAPSRVVEHLRLRGGSESAVRHALPALEDAFRTASLPDAGARLICVRRLQLGQLAANASAQSVSLLIEKRFAEDDRTIVHAVAGGADDAQAVWFRDALEAHEAAALKIAAGQPLDDWFWPLAIPAITAAASDERLRAIALAVGSMEEAPAALPVWTASLVRAGYRSQLIAALRPGDGRALMRSAGISAVSAAVRREHALTPDHHARSEQTRTAPAGPQRVSDRGQRNEELDDRVVFVELMTSRASERRATTAIGDRLAVEKDG